VRRSRQRHSLYSERADTAGGLRGVRGRTADEESARRRRRQWGLGLVGGTAIITSIAVMPGIAAAGAAAAAAAPVGVATAAGTLAEPAAVRVATAPVAAPAQQPGASPADAFAAAGYTFEDAQVLAAFWGIDSELEVKAVAGELLAAGTPLAESRFADPAAAEGYTSEELVDLFLACGYDGEDASVLAQAWGVSVDEAKSRAGTELKVVGVLPFVDPDLPPVPVEAGDGTLAPEYEAYFAAGYYYEDSLLLAEYWGLPSFEEAKVEAGRLILAGQPLPDVPGVAPD
jgi:hypothetical protein